MRKLVLMVLALVLLASPVFAAQTERVLVDDVTLSKTNTNEEEQMSIQDAKKVTFFVTIDNNRTTAAVTAVVTVAVSVDGTNWTDISWFDVAGGATPQTSETTTGVGQTYVGWLDDRLEAEYLSIKVKSTNMADNPNAYGTGDTADITVTVVEEK